MAISPASVEAPEQVQPLMLATPSKSSSARANAIGDVLYGTATFGPSNRQNVLWGLSMNLATDNPYVVILQARQGDNQDFNFPDTFDLQVVTTSASLITFRVRRSDADAGWGQNLRIDVMVFEGEVTI